MVVTRIAFQFAIEILIELAEILIHLAMGLDRGGCEKETVNCINSDVIQLIFRMLITKALIIERMVSVCVKFVGSILEFQLLACFIYLHRHQLVT